MKKQDEWEKIVRSKLEDYEVQPDPADWDAIVGRLTPSALAAAMDVRSSGCSAIDTPF